MKLRKQPTWKPTRKVTGAVVAGAVGMTGGAATLVWLGSMFGVDIPNEPAIFICGLIGEILGGYIPMERDQEA
ncbi:MAG: hypothetical protein ACR2QF_06995 [Geminicoccaceae bacterium]